MGLGCPILGDPSFTLVQLKENGNGDFVTPMNPDGKSGKWESNNQWERERERVTKESKMVWLGIFEAAALPPYLLGEKTPFCNKILIHIYP